MRHWKASLPALAVFAALGGAARADTLSYTLVYGVTNNASTSVSQTQSFTQFDPALGTLTNVTVSMGGTTPFVVNGFVRVFQAGGGSVYQPGVVITSAGTGVAVTGAGLNLSPANLTSFNTGKINGINTNIGSTSIFGTGTSGTASAAVDSGSFASYVGTGTVDVTLAVGNWTVSPPADAGFGFSIENTNPAYFYNTGGAVTVTYTYNAVPEPATVAMLGLGLGGVFMVARTVRRRRARVA